MTLTLQHYPSLVLAARPGPVPAALTLARPSEATFTNALGLVETAPQNVLRPDYDPLTGAYLGWLIEEPRTNLLRMSRWLEDAAWTRTGATVVRDLAGADGIPAAACRVTAASAGATITQAITAASARHILTFDLKPLALTGAVSLTLDGGATWTDVTAALVPGRFTRVTAVQTTANPVAGLRLSAAGDSVAADFAQVEAGAYPTSRIVSPQDPATRQGDVLTVDDLTPFWNPAEGSLMADARAFGASLASTAPRQTLLAVGDTSAATDALIEVQRQPDFGLRLGAGFGTSAGYGAAAAGAGSWGGESYRRIALGWSAGGADPSLVIDGTLYRAAVSGGGTVNAIAAEGRRLAIGHQRRGGVQRHFSGHIRLVLAYRRRLPDAVLTELCA